MKSFNTFMEAVESAHLKVANARGQSAMVQCPLHGDNNPSVSVTHTGDKTLVKDHGGCDTRDIVAYLGLKMEDLWDRPLDKEEKPVEVARYPYVDGRTGELLFYHVRMFPKTFRFLHFDKAGNDVWEMPKGVEPWLYRPLELKEGLDAGVPIWLVEGESDVHAIEAMGGVATTQPMGAGNNKWKDFHSLLLKKAREVRIVVDLDKDWTDPQGRTRNTGREYAMEVRQSLLNVGVRVTMWKSPVGKDAKDAYDAGKTLEDFKRYDLVRERVEGVSGSDLAVKEFPPLVYAVDKILPQGVALLAGSPKAGKSFVTLEMAVGVATGGKCLSELDCTQGDVLYVGLEDSERRLKDRIHLMMEGEIPDLSRIEFQTIDSGWIGGNTGMEWMEEWATEVEDPRLIVIDTLRKAEPDLDEARNQYIVEQEVMLRYKRFADRHNLTVLLVHHNNKTADDGDWLNRLSGTKGLTGGADTLLYIDYKRGEREGFLRIEGRDVVADDLPIHKPRGRPFWIATTAPDTLAGEAWADEPANHPTVELSARQREILAFLGAGKRTPEEFRGAFTGDDVGREVNDLVRWGLVRTDPTGIELAT